jgi:hypothetical protein
MDPTIEQLIAAVVSHVNRHQGYMTKTKLLKLLYLFDVEYYRVHRKTFTCFRWKYLHLGPWTGEYDAVVEYLLGRGVLVTRASPNPDNETLLYHTAEPVHIFRLFPEYTDERSLRLVVNAWGPRSTAEILDHVYFHTEPMLTGARGEGLDFSTLPEEGPVLYQRASSGKSPVELAEIRKRIAQGMSHDQERHPFTPPKYDEEFFRAIDEMETMY